MTDSDSLTPRLRRLRLLCLDVDGVLTDGRLYFSAAGEQCKAFHVRDGQGLRRLLESGMQAAFLSARESQATALRAAELGVPLALQGCADKAAGLNDLCRRLGCAAEETAYMGDDLGDLPALEIAGFAAAPADAAPEALQAADWVAQCAGGRGAVRELCDLILRARESRQ